MEGAEEVMPLGSLILCASDLRLDVFITHDNIIVLCEFLQLYDQLCGIHKVNDKYAKEQTDDKGKSIAANEPITWSEGQTFVLVSKR